MKALITISGVRGFVDADGTAQINLEDAARGLGFTRIAASGNEVVRWERVMDYLKESGFVPTDGHDGKYPEFIPENIFYLLAMKASNETATQFQRKVANEIMPAIRKHGGYLSPAKIEEALLNPDTLIRLAMALKEERAARIEAEKVLAITAPKAEAWITCAEDEGFLLSAREIAKTVALPGLNETQVRICLRELGILCKEKNEPTAEAIRSGMGRMILDSVDTGYCIKTIKTPKFRGKAIDAIVQHWKQKSGKLFS